MAFGSFWAMCADAMDEDPLYLFDKRYTAKYPPFQGMYEVPPFFTQDRDLFSLLVRLWCGDGCGAHVVSAGRAAARLPVAHRRRSVLGLRLSHRYVCECMRALA